MPTYSYICEDCGKTYEIKHKMTDTYKHLACKECTGNLKKVITGGTGFILKGKGWYKKENKSK